MELKILVRKIEEMIKSESVMLDTLEKEYKSINYGKLVVRKRGKIITFGEKTGNSEKGITRDKDRVGILILLLLTICNIKPHWER